MNELIDVEPEDTLRDKQAELPLATIRGTAVTEMPSDLYIPPEALEVFLEAFEGPLDLLLYLIKRQNLEILDIPIAEITRQYMKYIDLMKDIHLELAGEYLVMAAMLAEIKSRMLLPRPIEADDDESDPRAELVRRLQEYERYKQAAENISLLPQVGREIFLAYIAPPDKKVVRLPPPVSIEELLTAMRDVISRAAKFEHHQIHLEPLSVRERMSNILAMIEGEKFTPFSAFFTREEGRQGLVVSFLAILELLRNSVIELVQSEPYQPIYIKSLGSHNGPTAVK